MANPFPGMNPWLEQTWHDVHTRLIVHASGQLARQLPRGYRARVEEDVRIEEDEPGHYRPDITLWQPLDGGGTAIMEKSATAAEPIRVMVTPEIDRWVGIFNADGQLITAIEVISPTNKIGSELLRYRAKRSRLIRCEINLVEIDLVRKGGLVAEMEPHVRFAFEKQNRLPPYLVSVFRVPLRDVREMYPIWLQTPLPTFRVPLHPGLPDVTLNLQALIEQCYDEGRYDDIDYSRPLDPPLCAEDAAWVGQLLATRH